MPFGIPFGMPMPIIIGFIMGFIIMGLNIMGFTKGFIMGLKGEGEGFVTDSRSASVSEADSSALPEFTWLPCGSGA